MSWLDWLIVIIPVLILGYIAWHSKKFVRGVVDYVAAGRVCGRYVLNVCYMEGVLSVITLVAFSEQHYQTGYSVGFWSSIGAPISIVISLTGYCVYRWRETQCLSIGQFLELRYGSRFFRVFCAVLRCGAEMMTNALGPAIAANFFIYFLGLPHRVMICGINLPCYIILLFLILMLSVLFIWPSGEISCIVTGFVQGILSYPIFVLVCGYIILNLSWSGDIAPVMWNRVDGQSFMNPYDVSQFRDFNVFATVTWICSTILNRASWIGGGDSCAKNAHEQKMAGILQTWNRGLSSMMVMLVAILILTFMSSPDFIRRGRFKVSSTEVRQVLSKRVLQETVEEDALREKVLVRLEKVPAEDAQRAEIYLKTVTVSPEAMSKARSPKSPDKYIEELKQSQKDYQAGKPVSPEFKNTLLQQPMSQQKNLDTSYFDAVRETLGDTPQGRYYFQRYRALFNQMMMPVAMGQMLPMGLLGLFVLLMIMLLISTNAGVMFSSSYNLVQDIILPMFKGHLETKKHLLALRLMTVGVGIFFFIFAVFFSSLDYINMLLTILSSLWLGGAGPIMIFGLYSRFGNLTGAWCALLFGSGTSILGLLLQRNWALYVYPFFERMGWVDGLDWFLRTLTGPFNPWLEWHMDPVKYPVNSYENYFLSMILAVGGYVVGSLVTYKPYDLDKLLHRGKYSDGKQVEKFHFSFSSLMRFFVNITPEYTRGDKIIAWSVFIYSFIYGFLLMFIGIVAWNAISPWPHFWWTWKFFITTLLVPIVIGIVSTVWFMIGGIMDMRQMYRDLANRVDNPDDNGQVSVSTEKE